MRILNRQRATLQRLDGEGHWDLDGSYQAGSPTNYKIPCSIQPKITGSQYQKKTTRRYSRERLQSNLHQSGTENR